MKIKDYDLGTAKGTDKVTVSDGDTGETKNLTLDQITAEVATDYTESIISISAEDFLAGYKDGITLIAAPSAGTYYDWYAIVEKNSDGTMNIPTTDSIYIGPSGYRGGQLINDLGFSNNNSDSLVAFVSPSTSYVKNTNVASSFGGIAEGLIIASWTGVDPNAVSCSFTIKLYTKIRTIGE
jgi:hypothetical protein